MRVSRIDGKCSSENIGSQKVLEKIGMKNLEIKKMVHFTILLLMRTI